VKTRQTSSNRLIKMAPDRSGKCCEGLVLFLSAGIGVIRCTEEQVNAGRGQGGD